MCIYVCIWLWVRALQWRSLWRSERALVSPELELQGHEPGRCGLNSVLHKGSRSTTCWAIPPAPLRVRKSWQAVAHSRLVPEYLTGIKTPIPCFCAKCSLCAQWDFYMSFKGTVSQSFFCCYNSKALTQTPSTKGPLEFFGRRFPSEFAAMLSSFSFLRLSETIEFACCHCMALWGGAGERSSLGVFWFIVLCPMPPVATNKAREKWKWNTEVGHVCQLKPCSHHWILTFPPQNISIKYLKLFPWLGWYRTSGPCPAGPLGFGHVGSQTHQCWQKQQPLFLISPPSTSDKKESDSLFALVSTRSHGGDSRISLPSAAVMQPQASQSAVLFCIIFFTASILSTILRLQCFPNSPTFWLIYRYMGLDGHLSQGLSLTFQWGLLTWMERSFCTRHYSKKFM